MSVLTKTPEQLKDKAILFERGLAEEDGRISVYKKPIDGHLYVIGADFAYGLERGDYDAAVVVDVSVKPYQQVGELHGKWGERFDRILYAACMYWNDAFLCGERQVGLMTLRRLYDQYEYRYMYYEKSESARHRRVSDKLGFHLSQNDVTLPKLRRGVRDHEIELLSEPLLDQMAHTIYYAPTELTTGEKGPDEKLRVKLAGGGSPDLVRALCLAFHACDEVRYYPAPKPRFKKGTLGDIMGHAKLFEPPKRLNRRAKVR